MSPIALAVFFFIAETSAEEFNVLKYGAKPDGKTDSTNAFVGGWTEACACNVSGTVKVPRGRFLVSKVELKGPCNNSAILVSIEGTIVAPADYRVVGKRGYWVVFEEIEGAAINGGVIDAQGGSLWTCKLSPYNGACPSGATVCQIDPTNVDCKHSTAR